MFKHIDKLRIKKALSLLLAIVTLMGTLTFTKERVEAIEKDEKIMVYGGSQLTNFTYNEKSVLGSGAYFKEDGKEYPAYCLQPTKAGAGEHPNKEYEVSIDWAYDNKKVIGAILNGHPYKTPAEMGVDTEEEAYEVTKAVIWLYEEANSPYTDKSLWRASDSKIRLAFETLCQKAEANTDFFDSNKVYAKPVGTIEETKTYTKQVFEVTSDFGINSFDVTLKGTDYPAGTEVRDESGSTAKSTFQQGEKFTVYIPTEGLPKDSSGNVQVDIKANVISKVIWAGPPVIDDQGKDYQDYIMISPSQKAETNASVPYKTPPTTPGDGGGDDETTPLKIRKLKAGTQTGLGGAIFEVRDERDSVIWVGETDANGEINIVIPSLGKYSITELVAPLHYQLSDLPHKDIVIIADMETQIVTFENRPTTDLTVFKVDAKTNEMLKGSTIKLSLDGGHQSWTETTSASGSVVFRDLPDGTYTIEEIVSPNGYLLDAPKQVIKIVGGIANQTATFANNKKPGLLILKVDELTGVPLPNAEFQIKHKDGSIVHEGLTDENGTILLEGLEDGWYTVTELSAPEHYLKRDEFKDVLLKGGEQVQLKFDNRRRPALEILKLDEKTKKPLAGAKFNVWETESQTVSEYVTDETGRILIEDLDEKIYSIEEVTPPDGYFLDILCHKDINLEWGKTKTVIFMNREKPKLRIQKVDAITGELLKNSEFKVEKVEDKTVSEYILETGEIIISNLDEAVYKATEFMPPDGYIMLTESKEIMLEWGKTKTLKFDNVRKPVVVFRKLNPTTGKAVAGATYKVEYEMPGGGTKVIGSFITDKDGYIVLPKADIGWYIFTETMPAPGFNLDPTPIRQYFDAGDNAYTEKYSHYYASSGTGNQAGGTLPGDGNTGTETEKYEIKYGGDYTYVEGIGWNYPLGSVVLKKTDKVTGELLAGADIELYRVDEQVSGGHLIGTFTTDGSGVVVITGLKAGAYFAKEVKAPNNYLLDSNEVKAQTLKADEGNVIDFHFQNTPYGHLTISKIDSVTGKPLAGARFRVTTAEGTTIGNTNGEYTTDATGKILIENIKPGTSVIITEIQAPTGYTISESAKTLEIGQDGGTHSVIFKNSPYGSLLITKVDSITGEPLAGAKFKVIDGKGKNVGDGNGEFVTDVNGEILISLLEPNSYIITEIQAPKGYIISEAGKTVYVDDNAKTHRVDFKNDPHGGLVISKIDSITGEPLAGAKFKIVNSKGQVAGNSNGEYVTDSLGEFIITDLAPDSYVITELQAPDGYVITNTPKTIKVEATGNVYKLVFTNSPKGGLIVSKIDALTGVPLAGAKFKVVNGKNEVVGNTNGEYITNSFGEFIIYDLKPDSYIITEIQAPEFYAINTTPKTIRIEAEGETHKLVFENQPYGELIIKKYDEVTKEPLANAEFKVTTSSGDVVGTGNGIFKTDAKGTIEIPNLPKGSYVVQETKAPIGYILENQTQTIEIDYGKTYTLDFYNKPKSSIQIIKIDSETKKPLKDALFNVYKKNGELLGEYITDGNGLIIITDLDAGWYKIAEIKAPTGYQIDETAKDVELTSNQFLKVTFENKKLAGIVIKKTDDKSGVPLAGAKFMVEKQDGTFVGEYTTDSDGTINMPQVSPGWYVIREKQAPDGYLLDETPKTIEIKTNVPTVVTFTNKKLTGLQIKKVDDKSGASLSGAVFTVKKQNGETVYTNENGTEFVTDGNGFINIETLDPGYYIVTEIKAPDGYNLESTPKTVEVKTNAPTSITFTNKAKSGIQIIKVDADTNKPLSGARFTVYKKSGDVVGEYKTDANGVIILDQLDNGWYKIAETKAPEGYLIVEEPKDIEIKGNHEFHKIIFTNKKMMGLQIKKIDEQSGASLSGAVFTVKKQSGESVYTNENGTEFVTDQNGSINISNLNPGFYIVQEVKAPNNYILDQTAKTVEVKTNAPTVVTFTNKYKSGLQIIKVDADTNEPLSGARFTVYKKSGDIIGEYTTDANGVIIIDQLENGWYKIAETKAPDGYQIIEEPKDIEIKGNEFHKIVFKNKKLAGLIIKKIDSLTNKVLEGATFTVTKVNGEKVAEITTDISGIALVPNILAGTYIVNETLAPKGYVLDSTPRTIEVKTDGKSIELVFKNTPESKLQIKKVNSETRQPIEGVIFSLTRMNGEKVGEYTTDRQGMVFVNDLTSGTYILTELKAANGYIVDGEPQHIEIKEDGKPTIIEVENKPASGLLIVKTDSRTGKPLKGVVFDVRRADGQRVQGDIIDSNFPNTPNNSPNKNTTANGDIGGSYTTDANGRILINHLMPGEYHVIETKQLDGYILDTDVYAVTITPGKQASLQLKNVPKAGIRIKKIDSVSKRGIYDVEFRVYDFITKQEVAGPFYTDNNGEIDFQGILPAGRYTIMETREAQGYMRDETPRTIEFREGQILEIVWENTPLMGQIQITKLSSADNEMTGLEAGTPLAGAVFEIYNQKTNTLVDRFESGQNGLAISNPLPIGRYLIKETVAPKYYKISNKTIDIDVEFSGQIIKIDFTNEPSNIGVEIKKVGQTEAVANQQIKYDIKEVRNASTVPLTDFFWRDVVPSEIRINKIITGTYNQSLRYKIMFKTNKNEYRVATDNLSTTKNNVVDMSSASLGLPNGEYVTEFMLVFGNVKAGFCQVDIPQILATVQDGLPNGHKFANKVDVGGMYQGEWAIASSTWLMTIFRPVEPKLPKTGK